MKEDIEYKLLDRAVQSMGFYPAVMVTGDESRTIRTKWQEGWNKCLFTIYERWCKLCEVRQKIPEGIKLDFDDLIKNEVLLFSYDNNGNPYLYLLINDTFCKSYSGGEEVDVKDLVKINQLRKEFGYSGLIAWVSTKRGTEPLAECQDSQYKSAIKKIRKR